MTPPPDTLRTRLRDAWPPDRPRLRGRLRRLERGKRRPGGQALDAIEAEIARSAERWAARRNALPKITYPEELPIAARREEIAEAVRTNQVVVVCGETGSGKTTQLPKLCLELGMGVDRLIGHTQPRRIAARTVADRIAEELAVAPGTAVGHKVRFTDRTREDTLVKLMTDGILLAETQRDRRLEHYECLIIDEAHERSLNIDFLLGYLHRLLPQRPDLKVIVTSATIDPERFAEHFAGPQGPAPIISVSGRTYPVDVRYRPPAGDATMAGSVEHGPLGDAILGCVEEIEAEDPSGHGDVLIFMPGEREILQTAKLIRHRFGERRDREALPLYARLSPAEQERAFRPHPGRRFVIATNVAETSLTVPGIKYVIDPGTARLNRYNARTKVTGLEIEPISQASAEQRKGRCGRIGPGVCYRLYDETDFEQREAFTPPEIKRTNLASVVLQMSALKLGRPEDFPFIEPPGGRMVRDAYDTLFELGAIDDEGALTEIGARLARLPIDPRLGRMIMAAEGENCVHDALIITAALSAPDPRDRPIDKQAAADEAHERFRAEGSDFLSFLNLWDFVHEQSAKLSRRQFEKACRQNFLVPRRIHEWREIYRQIRSMTADIGIDTGHGHAPPDAVHRALLTGLLANVGKKGDGHEYDGTHTTKFHIFPGSSVFEEKPRWIMSAEVVRTTRQYARTVGAVEPEWIEEAGKHLVKRSHYEPRWDRKSARVVAYERVSLLGLEIVTKRQVHFGPIDPETSRRLFIHHALLEREWDTRVRTIRTHRELTDRIARLEAKSRRSDLLADYDRLFAFYDTRLPTNVYSAKTFERWLKQAEQDDPNVLRMRESDLLVGDAKGIDEDDYPDTWETLTAPLHIDYAFDPGSDADGVTLRVPVELLGQLRAERIDRVVPGLLEEKIAALVRTLPRTIRRNFDAREVARRIRPKIAKGTHPLVQDVALELGRITGERIEPGHFRPEELERHLHVRFVITDDRDKELGTGRDLAELRQRFADQIPGSARRATGSPYDRDDLTDWDLDDMGDDGKLPESVTLQIGSANVEAYPALVDLGTRAGVRLFDTRGAADASMRAGLARLYVRHLRDEFRYWAEHMPGIERLRLLYAPLGPADELERDLLLLIADQAFIGDNTNVRTRAQFTQRIDRGWNTLGEAAQRVSRVADAVLSRRHELVQRLDKQMPTAWGPSKRDIEIMVGAMVGSRVFGTTPWLWLQHVPRYLAAGLKRLDKLRTAGPNKDIALAREVAVWAAKYAERAQKHNAEGVVDPALAEFRWLIEEYRVSLFAQELGTSVKVSPKRLDDAWRLVRV